MGRKRKQTKAPLVEEPGSGFGGLAAALQAEGLSVSAPSSSPSPPPTTASPTGLRGKVVVRQERKGRGGKTVTVIDGAAVRGTDAAALAKRLRKALGTGARVEGAAIVVQGDQREAAARWLTAQGAKVTIGN